MKIFWIFAALFGIFMVVEALPVSSEVQKEAVEEELDLPEEAPPAEEETAFPRRNDSWGSKSQSNVIEVPVVCPEGQLLDHLGDCRDIW
uniref:Uncharacterized protein n=1 Tax=Phlebotomus papatasi TaxID=29031 RepID=A0A1B0GMT7_PHLPP